MIFPARMQAIANTIRNAQNGALKHIKIGRYIQSGWLRFNRWPILNPVNSDRITTRATTSLGFNGSKSLYKSSGIVSNNPRTPYRIDIKATAQHIWPTQCLRKTAGFIDGIRLLSLQLRQRIHPCYGGQESVQ